MFRNVVTKIREKLRAFLQIEEREPDIAEVAERKGVSIHAELLRRAGEKNVVDRKVTPPVLLPGVVPAVLPKDDPGHLGPYLAADSAEVAPMYAYANQVHCGLGFPGYAYLAELSQRTEYRAPSETIASEMCREWCKLVVKGDTADDKDETKDPDKNLDDEVRGLAGDVGPDLEAAKNREQPEDDADGGDDEVDDPEQKELADKIEKLNAALEKFCVRESMQKIAELDGLFGRAQLFIDIDHKADANTAAQLPLLIEPETIKQGSLKGFKVIEPIWTTPFTYNATDPTAADFYVPRAWFVLGRRVHATRLLTFVMREVPDILKPAYNFGGLSMSQLMESSVFRWLRTANSVSDLIHNFSVMVLKTNMGTVLQGQRDEGLLARAQFFTQYRDNQGLTLLDKNTEELEAVNVPLSGLEGLQAQSQEHLAAPSHIPLVKLLGVTPTGLNASSEGEIKVFYDFVRACQQKFFGPHLKTILQILQLHLFGEIDERIGFEWVPLTAPTVKEQAEIRKADAETASTYIDKGVLDPAEVRARLASDPNSGYNNISGKPPKPPEQINAEHGAELQEGAATTAHERSEEAAEAAHERDLEKTKTESKLNKASEK